MARACLYALRYCGRRSSRTAELRIVPELVALSLILLLTSSALAQAHPPTPNSSAKQAWAFALTSDGYVTPNEDGYISPILVADRACLHLEARYNYENLKTGSLWVGYTFSVGKRLVLDVTPMIGGVFGRTTGIAPGFEASLTYNKVQLSISNEYVFDTGDQSSSFYYDWPELTYSPMNWLHVGLVAQRTKAYHTSLDTQRGFFVGVSHKKIEFITYVFNAGWTDPTVVLEAGFSF